ncbi:MAG: response regulator transcription factor [Chloroflexota bacterium]
MGTGPLITHPVYATQPAEQPDERADGRPIIRVLVVDDLPRYRRELRTICSSEKDLSVVGEAASGQEALALVKLLEPDVILMDLQMPGMDGVQATELIMRANPEARVILLTVFRDVENILSALQAGARAHLPKSSLSDEIIHMVRAVYRGKSLVDSQVTARVLDQFRRLAELHAEPGLR